MKQKPSVKGIDIFLPQQNENTEKTEQQKSSLSKTIKNEYKYIHKYSELGLKQTAFWLTKKAIKTLKIYALKHDKTQSQVVEELINKYCKLPEDTTIEKIVTE